MLQKTHCRTKSGQDIWYEDPSKILILEDDMFEALKNSRRYSGQLDVTILQHLALCVYLANHYGCKPLETSYVAAHDLHEAYVNDIPKGLKECLPEYQKIETAWEDYVHKHLGLLYPLPKEIQTRVTFIDLRALCVEIWHGGWNQSNIRQWNPIYRVALGTGGIPTEKELECMTYVSCREDEVLWGTIMDAIITGAH
jgi:hypothetical protein